MNVNSKDLIIKRIINLEKKINQCDRCYSANTCMQKPALGKGDLEPEILLVFADSNRFNQNHNHILEIRSMIIDLLKIKTIYHTFLVRCQTRVCRYITNNPLFANKKKGFLSDEGHCLLINEPCTGALLEPGFDQIIACMSYIMEEVDVLRPKILILFGDQVAKPVLKAYGFFSPQDYLQGSKPLYVNGMRILVTVREKDFNKAWCQDLLHSFK